jgi:hypothetical protein
MVIVNNKEKQMAKAIAPSKLVPGTTYTLHYGKPLIRATYKGVGFANSDGKGPLKPYTSNGFAHAAFGHRFIFEAEGRQILLRKAYTKNLKSGLVFEDTVVNPAATLVKRVVKFFA